MKKENKKEERYKMAVAAKAVVYDEKTDKFLLIKAKNPTKYFLEKYGEWEYPGGKNEENEKIKEGLEREVAEEIGRVDFEVIAPVSVKKITTENGPILVVDYLVRYKQGEIVLSGEHSEYIWESAEEIEKKTEYRDWLKNLIGKAKIYLEKEKALESWRRLAADFENYKKRQAQNLKDTVRFANMNLLTEILPVIDNFHASTGHIPEGQKESPWVVGIMHIQKQLEKVLEDNGVSEIVVKMGDNFDPAIMEAVENKEEGGEYKNIVKKVLIKGYRLGDKVLRATRVIVE